MPIFFERRADRVLGRLGAPAGHRRRLPGARDRPRRQLVGGQHLPRDQAVRSGRAPGPDLAPHPREHAHADVQPRRHRGDDRRLRAGAQRRYLELLGRYGRDAVLSAADGWLDYSERMLRPGDRQAAGRNATRPTSAGSTTTARTRGVKLPVKVAVKIEGDEITFDLTGSSAEVPTGFNCPYEGTTVSAMTFITRMIFLDEVAYPVFVPQNEGMLRPVNVIAPKGSIFNPNFPRACFARFCQVQRAVDLALRALVADRPGEDHGRQLGAPALHLLFGLRRGEGEYWVYLEVDEGSYGGRHDKDGLDSIDCLIANTRNNPIEELEWRYPMRTERYELRDDAVRGRQVARGHRHDPHQPLPRGHDRHLRGRAHRVRPALGDLRRPRRRQRFDQDHHARRRGRSVAVEVHRPHAVGRRRRSRSRCPTPAATATRCSATPSWCSRTCSTGSRRPSWPSATTAW